MFQCFYSALIDFQFAAEGNLTGTAIHPTMLDKSYVLHVNTEQVPTITRKIS